MHVRCAQCPSSQFQNWTWSTADVFLAQQTEHHQTLSGPRGLTVPRIFSLLSSWFFLLCCSHKYFGSMCLMAPLPLKRASPRAAAACPRFVREPRVPALVSCWPNRWPHTRSVPCCSAPIPRCSVTPLFVSTIKLPRCVDRRASILRMSSVMFFGQPAASASETLIFTTFSSVCSGNSHTARGVCKKQTKVL